MSHFLNELSQAVRQRPYYAVLLVLTLLGFGWGSLNGYRLLGDDNETDATELVGGPRTGGHGGAARFYHK